MITVSKCVANGALRRKESRGGHTRDDFPNADPELGKLNFAQSSDGGHWDDPVSVNEAPILIMPDELKALLEEDK
jgi:succinate dehydrogenase / fumarate reductase flavoprotein subunit